MPSLKEELKSAGVYPVGPVSAWPRERNDELGRMFTSKGQEKPAKPSKLTAGRLATNLAKTAGQALMNGKVSAAVRKARYDTCKACPAFNPSSKRCNDCGCFMEAKTWVGGNPRQLCPREKWSK